MSRGVTDSLNDILTASLNALDFLGADDLEEFRTDLKTQYAVVRALEVVGEAARRVGDEFRAEHPEVPWRSMTGMRDKLIHDYFGVSEEVVWRTVRDELPALIEKITSLIQELSGE